MQQKTPLKQIVNDIRSLEPFPSVVTRILDLANSDTVVPDDLMIPGYEYHYMDDSMDDRGGSPELYSQIPAGFAGAISEHDDAKADASPWLDKIPVIRRFRRKLLGQK